MKTLTAKLEEYNNNIILHIYECDNTIVAKVYNNIEDLYNHSIEARMTSVGYSVTMPTAQNFDMVLCSVKDFNKGAEAYYRKCKARAYRAYYSEVIASKVLKGKHNNIHTEHGKGDIIVKGQPIEVKYGKEVII